MPDTGLNEKGDGMFHYTETTTPAPQTMSPIEKAWLEYWNEVGEPYADVMVDNDVTPEIEDYQKFVRAAFRLGWKAAVAAEAR